MAKMIRKNTIAAGIMIACMIVGLVSCNKDKDNFDASGSFEAIETIVSAEANGRIERLEIEEGQELEAWRNIGFIDSTQLFKEKAVGGTDCRYTWKEAGHSGSTICIAGTTQDSRA